MADFKIKPAAGTGNKLILESEDGTDVLTTSDSGVSITAPTITGDTTNNGNIIMATNKKVQQKGAFMQSSTHQALTLGG